MVAPVATGPSTSLFVLAFDLHTVSRIRKIIRRIRCISCQRLPVMTIDNFSLPKCNDTPPASEYTLGCHLLLHLTRDPDGCLPGSGKHTPTGLLHGVGAVARSAWYPGSRQPRDAVLGPDDAGLEPKRLRKKHIGVGRQQELQAEQGDRAEDQD